MKHYNVINTATSTITNRIVVNDIADWTCPAGYSVTEISTETAPVAPLSKLEFLRRFTAEERIAIRASVNTSIIDFMDMLSMAEYIDLTDPDTIAGVQYAEYLNLIASGRATTILTP